MPDAFLTLGAAVVKTAAKLWLKKEPFAAELSGSVIDVIVGRVSGDQDQRRARRLFTKLELIVADRLEAVLGHEFSGLEPNERESAVLAVADGFGRAELTDRDLFASDLDARFLERHIRAGRPDATRDLGPVAAGFHDLLLTRCCAYVIEFSSGLPGFTPGALAEILRRETEILDGVRELLGRTVDIAATSDPEVSFEQLYLRQVATTLDRLEVFGLTVSDTVRRYPLSTAYISLSLRRPGPSADDSADPVQSFGATSLGIEQAVEWSPRVFLRGEAGSGKTTLLQWLAVRYARSGERVPFLLPLRRYVGREPPEPSEFVTRAGRHIADEMPKGWVQRQLRSNRALVLIDGIDELPEPERPPMREWLRSLIDAFPGARYVVTSRPAATPADWLEGEGFDSAEIQPMSWSDITSFIRHWHAALAASPSRDGVHEYERELLEKLRTRRHLRALATNPLLCALLCALHLDRRAHLPRDRMELYQIALDLLLERRDSERRLYDDDPISRTDKTLLLQGFAYWLIRNGRSDASRKEAVQEIGRSLAMMPRVTRPPEQVLRHLLVRSGLIRSAAVDRVDFVHRTFQEYLAGRAAVEAGDIGSLVRNADDDQWREVIILAAGHAHPQQRAQLLRGLLDEAGRHTRNDRRSAERGKSLKALAVACLETSAQLDVGLQREIREVARALLPPRSIAEARSLAKAGAFILDLLADNPPADARQAEATIRVASEIGGSGALPLITRCARFESDRVREELMRAWPQFEPAEFARTVLRDSPYRKEVGAISNGSLLPSLGELPELERLSYRIPVGYGDLSFVSALPRLTTLHVRADPALRDLRPLAGCERLNDVRLNNVGEVDLGPMTDLANLEQVTLDNAGALDLTPLRSCHRLTHLALAGLPPLWEPAGMAALTGCLPSAKLTLFSLQGTKLGSLDRLLRLRQLDEVELLLFPDCQLTDINAIVEWSETLAVLSLRGTEVTSSSALTPLHGLRRLDLSRTRIRDLSACGQGMPWLEVLALRNVDRLPDLSPLRDLPRLARLLVEGGGPVDLRPLAGKTGLTVITRRQRVYGAELLGEGSEVVRS